MMRAFRPFALVLLAWLAVPAAFTPPAAAQQSTWDAIQARGSLRVGATQAPPWYLKDPQSGEWSGLGIAVGGAMAETLGVELEVVEVTWGNAIAALQADQIDIVFVLDATPERALAVDFPAAPLLYYALAVIVADDVTVETWQDLNQPDITIAVTQGTTIDSYVSQHCPNAEILRFPTNSESVAAFQSGRADAASLFHPPLIALQKQMGKGKIVLPAPIRSSTSSAAVRREADKTWRDWVSTAIAYYYETNQTQVWYDEFLRSFGVDPNATPPIRKELW
jgi:polar amino acid transport system substrate-binding protein